MAFVGTRGGIRQIYLRSLESQEARPLAGTEGAICTPVFSPDGKWLAFLADGKLQKLSVTGGAPITLASAEGGFSGASWGDDGNIVIGGNDHGIQRIPATGGVLQSITKVDAQKGEHGHTYPQVLPGAKGILFGDSFGDRLDETRIMVQDFRTGERRVVAEGGNFPHYVPSGYVVYVRAGTLMAVPFDLERLQATGVPVPIAENVMESGFGAAEFGFSRSGSLVYVPGGLDQGLRKLVWVDRKGMAQPLAAPPRPYGFPRISPDGRRVATMISGIGFSLWVFDLEREALTQLTAGGFPVWTPDGKRVAYGKFSQNLFWKPVDESEAEELLWTGEFPLSPASWSSDGRHLAFLEAVPATRYDIWVLPLDGERKPKPWLATPSNESAAMFSPDGRWITYVSNESGQYEVYVRPYPGPGEKWQISPDGGTEPAWAHSGRELFYRHGDKMMVAEITLRPSFNVGKPKVLFEGTYARLPGPGEYLFDDYDVSADDQRFLMVQESNAALAATQINVVLNWFEELKQKVPVN